jgi:hypothetical protein
MSATKYRHPSRQHDRRGNSYDRARRKERMLNEYGDGKTVECTHCGVKCDWDTVESDRKDPGGTYAFHNVQPSCGPCNRARGDDPTWVHPSRVGVA